MFINVPKNETNHNNFLESNGAQHSLTVILETKACKRKES